MATKKKYTRKPPLIIKQLAKGVKAMIVDEKKRSVKRKAKKKASAKK